MTRQKLDSYFSNKHVYRGLVWKEPLELGQETYNGAQRKVFDKIRKDPWRQEKKAKENKSPQLTPVQNKENVDKSDDLHGEKHQSMEETMRSMVSLCQQEQFIFPCDTVVIVSEWLSDVSLDVFQLFQEYRLKALFVPVNHLSLLCQSSDVMGDSLSKRILCYVVTKQVQGEFMKQCVSRIFQLMFRQTRFLSFVDIHSLRKELHQLYHQSVNLIQVGSNPDESFWELHDDFPCRLRYKDKLYFSVSEARRTITFPREALAPEKENLNYFHQLTVKLQNFQVHHLLYTILPKQCLLQDKDGNLLEAWMSVRHRSNVNR